MHPLPERNRRELAPLLAELSNGVAKTNRAIRREFFPRRHSGQTAPTFLIHPQLLMGMNTSQFCSHEHRLGLFTPQPNISTYFESAYMQETQAATMLATISITMIDQHGQSHAIDATPGETLMEVAKANDIAGIDADCGGCCACGTCRMEISPALQQLLPPASDDELAVIAFVGDDSGMQRLGCQMEITPEFHLAQIKVAT